jgi:hypothetical protein
MEIDLPVTEQRGCHASPRAGAAQSHGISRSTPRGAAHSPPIGRD